MSGHNYPDNLYADALSKVRAVTGKPTGAYQAPAEMPAAERKLRTALAYVNHARDLITEALAIQPLGGMRTDQPEGCNPGAMREAKIAYDMACERVRNWLVEQGGDVPLPVDGRIPKWHPDYVKPVHPMNAEAIRDHDERLSGAEDRL